MLTPNSRDRQQDKKTPSASGSKTESYITPMERDSSAPSLPARLAVTLNSFTPRVQRRAGRKSGGAIRCLRCLFLLLLFFWSRMHSGKRKVRADGKSAWL